MLEGCWTDAGRMLGGCWSDARRTWDQTVAGVVTVVVTIVVTVAVAVAVLRALADAPAPASALAAAPAPAPAATPAPAPASLYFLGAHATLRCALEALWYLKIPRDGVHGCVPPMRARPSDLVAVVVVAVLRSQALLLGFVEPRHLFLYTEEACTLIHYTTRMHRNCTIGMSAGPNVDGTARCNTNRRFYTEPLSS